MYWPVCKVSLPPSTNLRTPTCRPVHPDTAPERRRSPPERGSATRSAWPAEPMSEPTSASPCQRHAPAPTLPCPSEAAAEPSARAPSLPAPCSLLPDGLGQTSDFAGSGHVHIFLVGLGRTWSDAGLTRAHQTAGCPRIARMARINKPLPLPHSCHSCDSRAKFQIEVWCLSRSAG